MDAQMPERESGLWLRGALWVIVAPGLLTILVYVAAPWVAPLLSEPDRTRAAVMIGFGAAFCLGGIIILGTLRLAASDGERAPRIAVQSIATSSIAIGLAAALLAISKPGSVLAWMGAVLGVGGIIIRVAAHITGAFLRSARRRDTPS